MDGNIDSPSMRVTIGPLIEVFLHRIVDKNFATCTLKKNSIYILILWLSYPNKTILIDYTTKSFAIVSFLFKGFGVVVLFNI